MNFENLTRLLFFIDNYKEPNIPLRVIEMELGMNVHLIRTLVSSLGEKKDFRLIDDNGVLYLKKLSKKMIVGNKSSITITNKLCNSLIKCIKPYSFLTWNEISLKDGLSVLDVKAIVTHIKSTKNAFRFLINSSLNGVYLSEQFEQEIVFEWARKTRGLNSLFHIPNGGHRAKGEANRLKKAGVLAGVPDICLPQPLYENNMLKYHALYIEIKAMFGRVSEEQKEIIEIFSGNGNNVHVCYGHKAAITVLCEYTGISIPFIKD